MWQYLQEIWQRTFIKTSITFTEQLSEAGLLSSEMGNIQPNRRNDAFHVKNGGKKTHKLQYARGKTLTKIL